MADIPNQEILWSIKSVVQGDGEFHHAKAGAQMPFFGRYDINDEFPKFDGQFRQFFLRKLTQIGWGIYGI